MRKVELRVNEENKYMIIKKLVETNGNKKRAAIKLGCSTRTINRLILKYKAQGKAAFVHGNRGRLPSKTIPLDTKNMIIKLYIDKFSDANFTHFCEIIYEDYNIKISDTTLNKWLREENIISPKARKKTKKLLKKALNAKLNDTKSKKIQDDIKETIIFIDCKVSSKDRELWPIVCDSDDNIVWLPGLKKSKFCKEKSEKCDIILKYY